MADCGTISAYINDECRCGPCAEAIRAYRAKHRRPADFAGPAIPRADAWSSTEPRTIVNGTGWRDRAACRGMGPSLFFPERGDNYTARDARLVCASCPVTAECRAAGAGEAGGIWGGSGVRRGAA